MKATIEKLLRKENLSREEAVALMSAIVSGEVSPAQIAGVLIALRAKGETVDEITGFVSVLRDKAVRVSPARDGLVDTCGTGGDGTHTFNISTAAAIVAAGAGVGIAKHGNRALSSKCGSSDVLEAMGVRTIPAERVAEVIDRVGIGFMHAPSHHPALKHAADVRRELGVRTVFNLLGPMANPAFVKRQLVGVFDPVHTETVARVLGELGSEKVYVVHGSDGSDEVTVTGDTRVTVLDEGRVETFSFSPESVGLPRSAAKSILGGTPEENAATIHAILEGAPGPKRDAVVLNAAFVIAVAGRAESVADGVQLAAAAIDDGRAQAILEQLRVTTRDIAMASTTS